MTDVVRSASRVLDLLEHLAFQGEGVSLTQAAAGLGLPKSSTLMLLRTLVSRGYASKDDADRYRLNDTVRALGFGWGGHRLARLVASAEPMMHDLCRRLDETIILGALDGTHVRLLAKSVAAQTIRYDIDLSTPTPVFCTAMGRVLLAFAPEASSREILKASDRRGFTAATVTALPALEAIIQAVRQERLAVVEEEYVLGGTGVAAPVFGPDGEVLAALDVGCVTSRFHLKRDAIVTALRETAETLSAVFSLAAPDQTTKRKRANGQDERKRSNL